MHTNPPQNGLFGIDDVDRDYIWTYPTNLDDPSQIKPDFISSRATWSAGNAVSVYVHVPFCQNNCAWCVFYREKYDASHVSAFVDSVLSEIHAYGQLPSLAQRHITALYFGGGTASLLSPNFIRHILDAFRAHFLFEPTAEITVECHPNSTTLEHLCHLRTIGVNRVSFGIQSFNGDTLRVLGVSQTSDGNLKALENAKLAGFQRINMDLMYRAPGQTLSDLELDLSAVNSSNATGVSCYSLEATGTRYEATGKTIAQPNAGMDFEMFYLIDDQLSDYGFRRTAQPDFVRPGMECRYLETIWNAPQTCGFGIGPSAFSPNVNGYALLNISSLDHYIHALKSGRFPITAAAEIDASEAIAKYFVLGVRGIEVPLQPFEDIFGYPATQVYGSVFDSLSAAGLIEMSTHKLSLTRAGLYFVDNISKRFFTERCRDISVPWGEEYRCVAPREFPVIPAFALPK